jgi:fructose-bisphosphate aldolase, class I
MAHGPRYRKRTEAAVSDYGGAIPLILRRSNHDVLNDEKDPISAIISGVNGALHLGYVAIGFTIYPGSQEIFP